MLVLPLNFQKEKRALSLTDLRHSCSLEFLKIEMVTLMYFYFVSDQFKNGHCCAHDQFGIGHRIWKLQNDHLIYNVLL